MQPALALAGLPATDAGAELEAQDGVVEPHGAYKIMALQLDSASLHEQLSAAHGKVKKRGIRQLIKLAKLSN